jgi:CheY-like chemotaxis protein
VAKPHRGANAARGGGAEAPGGRPTVLAVDDEPLILGLLGIGLPRCGLDVRTALGGREALEVYRLHRRTIDLVLLEVQMRGLDGLSTMAALRAIDPDVRAVFMSGSMGAYHPEPLLVLGGVRVIPKPFHLPDLAAALWAALGRQPP